MLANTKLHHLHRLDICVCFANQLLLIAISIWNRRAKMLIVLNSLFSPLVGGWVHSGLGPCWRLLAVDRVYVEPATSRLRVRYYTTTLLHPPVIFYCPMLCIARTVLSLDVRPSVRPSHASVVSKPLTYHHTFSPSGSNTILVFPYQTLGHYSHVTPYRGRWIRGYEKSWFLTCNSLYLGNDTR